MTLAGDDVDGVPAAVTALKIGNDEIVFEFTERGEYHDLCIM